MVFESLPLVDFSDYEARQQEISDEIWRVATDVGFFYAVNHGIPDSEVDAMFEASQKFFACPSEVKARVAYDMASNNGWEAGTEVLDESQPDMKETYNVGYVGMGGKWLGEEECPGFKQRTELFQQQCKAFSEKILRCFAISLGFDKDFFLQYHDPSREDCMTLLRLLYYPELNAADVAKFGKGQMRAGSHTDYGCVTLLFQRPGQGGLEVRLSSQNDLKVSTFPELLFRELDRLNQTGTQHEHINDRILNLHTTKSQWVEVDPVPGAIVINIGDSMMRWSDDKLKSNFHRVRVPRVGEYLGPRYSMAYFNQPNKFAIIQGPERKYPPITAGEYLMQRFGATYVDTATSNSVEP